MPSTVEVSLPNQNTYVRLALSQLWDNLPLILLASGVFSVVCMPAALLFWLGLFAPAILLGALTVVPGWIALLALETDMACARRAGIGAMLRALPRYWQRGAGLGLLASFPLLMGLITLPNLARTEVPLVVWVGLAGDGLGLLLLLILSIYTGPLLVLHDMAVGTALRNALLLACRHIANTIGLLSMIVVLAFLAYRLSLPLLLLLPATWGLFLVNNCRMVVAEEVASDPSNVVCKGT